MRLTWVGAQLKRLELSSLVGAVSAHRRMLVLPVLAAGLLFRLVDIAEPFIGRHMWNEIYYVTIARNFEHFGLLAQYNYDWLGGLELSPRFGPPPLVSWLVYGSSELLGTAEWVARLPILVLGMFSLLILYGIARELYGDKIALGAIFFAAIMPGIVFFSRQVALDGPMAAFGLAACWTLLIARRKRQYRWAFVSAVFLSLAIFTKYTAVLFTPCLAYIWYTMLRGADLPRGKARWVLPLAYLVVATLPAAVWFMFTLQASRSQADPTAWSRYLNRAREWNLQDWYRLLQVAWPRLADFVGHMLWYPLVLAAVLALAVRSLSSFVKRHIEVMLLIVPWFAQMVYPSSWMANDAYSYSALYGVAILLAVALHEVLGRARQQTGFSDRKLQVGLSFLAVLVCLSCLSDYRELFHSWYRPDYDRMQQLANAVTPYDPFLSARLVRSINTSHQPVLADLPATLYYALDEYWAGRAVYWWWVFPGEQKKMTDAITSREFTYVVFAYQPPLDVTEALTKSAYLQIGPAAWEKADIPR